MSVEMIAVLLLLLLIAALVGAVLLRRPRVDLPPEWLARLQALEATTQSTQLAVAKNDGALDGMAQQLRGFTQTTQGTLEGLRGAVDERLAQAVAESRTGRAELLAAFGAFEAKLEQRLAQGQADAAVARKELSETLLAFRTELTQTAQQLASDSVRSREALAESTKLFEQRIQERFEALTAATRGTLDSLKGDIHTQLGTVSTALKDQLEANGQQIRNQFAVLQDAVSQQLGAMAQGSAQNAEALRGALNERLAAIQADNTAKLEEMRRTVDEKLHATLEQRLGESFKLVSDRLEQVHKGLGEMQTLAGSVGDLKRVMTNVKTRGTWGEMQLGAIIENVLTPDQFARNVKAVPGSDDLVEFAIRLPGRNDEKPVWLPIDSKYPVEQYQRLLDAQDAADKAAILSAGNAFETSIKLEARKIFSKYVSPPHTTDFAVLYLPTEGLFAEVIRRPGLVEAVQNDCRVMITGPANLAAMLSSLQMGFKTLAIEKRSSEVWGVLGSVKTEFAKFGEIVESAKKSIDAAAKKFDDVGVRTRAIQRKLRDVQELPAPTASTAAGTALPVPPAQAGLSLDDEGE
ncbi:DNA recombination protein RmuC [Paracidovorax wautersii]|uniref:DNA recombination protein RmuC n=1 Tax=Paracidovorax wautersii TaxID=1177982 RepID=A0ABU1IG40_9BURK|nr:DNA recombination protein RmuC [Paracidovorax wautersii]MDR6215931.1 DNA recombination protein RmuC [Paracidovorax wautersii]